MAAYKYDLEVDTSILSPFDGADAIVKISAPAIH
jgi:chloramphenicol 3-O-phosphotransferase